MGFLLKLLHLMVMFITLGMLLRVLGQWKKLSNDLGGYDRVVYYTQKLVQPIANLVGSPKIFGIEWVSLGYLLLMLLLQTYLNLLVGQSPHISWAQVGLMILSTLVIDVLNLLFFAMLIELILPWTTWAPLQQISALVRMMTQPFLNYSKDLLPVMGGIDVAPLMWSILFKMVAFVIYASMAIALR